MFELLMTVCLISDPTICEDVRLDLSEESRTAIGCMVAAQAEMARWSEEHPDRTIKRWSCDAVKAPSE